MQNRKKQNAVESASKTEDETESNDSPNQTEEQQPENNQGDDLNYLNTDNQSSDKDNNSV